MRDSKPVVYSVDTSTLMEWQDRFYPRDVFPSIVTLFDELIEQERLFYAQIVKEEVSVMGSEGLCKWAEDRGIGLFCVVVGTSGRVPTSGRMSLREFIISTKTTHKKPIPKTEKQSALLLPII